MFVQLIPFVYTESGIASIAQLGAAWGNAWGYSYQTRHSGFENYPGTQPGQNWAFWDERYFGVKRIRGAKRIKVLPGAVATVLLKRPTCAFTNLDYDMANTAAGSGYPNYNFARKSVQYLIRIVFETGLVRGTTNASSQPTGGTLPLISSVGGDWAVKITAYYSYRWIAGAHAPQQAGSWLAQYGATTYPGTESINNVALGYVRDPSTNSLKQVWSDQVATGSTNFTTWGPGLVYNTAGGGAVSVNVGNVNQLNPFTLWGVGGVTTIPHTN